MLFLIQKHTFEENTMRSFDVVYSKTKLRNCVALFHKEKKEYNILFSHAYVSNVITGLRDN